MAIYLGGRQPKGMSLGARTVSEMYLGDRLIYANQGTIFKDGKLMDGVTLSTIQERADDLYLAVNRAMGTAEGYSNNVGYVLFDMTNYKTVTVRGKTWCYGYSGNEFHKKLGIDAASPYTGTELPVGFNDLFDRGNRADFEQVFNVESLTGVHSLAVFVSVNNFSGYYGAGSYISITEIIGGR